MQSEGQPPEVFLEKPGGFAKKNSGLRSQAELLELDEAGGSRACGALS